MESSSNKGEAYLFCSGLSPHDINYKSDSATDQDGELGLLVCWSISRQAGSREAVAKQRQSNV